jgi:FKBP-type peptidyl-prolyl cis-trans isomerase
MVSLLFSCNNSPSSQEKKELPDLKEPLIEANQKALDTESEQISDFLKRYKWDMTETGSGLRYWVYKKGQGENVSTGDVVEIEYIVSLLNGDTVYTSEERGELVFIPGRAQVISGLEEGILLLRQGDHAKFIIPSHLAYGLIGDQDRIGKKATLVYDVKVLRIKKEIN